MKRLFLTLLAVMGLMTASLQAQNETKVSRLYHRHIKEITQDWILTNADEVAQYPNGLGSYFYQCHLNVTEEELEGRCHYIYFDGVNNTADLLVNHRQAGHHVGAQTAFCYEITQWLHPGDNLLEVWAANTFRTDILPLGQSNELPGGIYLPVRHISTATNCIPPDFYGTRGILIHQRSIIPNEEAELQFEVKVRRAGDQKPLSIRLSVFDANQQLVAQAKSPLSRDIRQTLTSVNITTRIEHPHLWNGSADPYKYLAYVQLLDSEGEVIDESGTRFGIRVLSKDEENRVMLNGVPYCEVDSFTVGQLPFIAPSNSFPTGYLPTVEANAKEMLTELIYQQYNWPEVIFWGLAKNLEADEDKSYGDPIPFVQQLNELAHKLDPTRLTLVHTDNPDLWAGAADIIATPATAPFQVDQLSEKAIKKLRKVGKSMIEE